MKIIFTACLMFLSIVAYAHGLVGELLAKPAMNKFEAEVIAEASKAPSAELACEILLKSVSKKWAGAPLLFNLGNVYFQLEEYSKAIKYYKMALEKEKFFLAYKNLACAYSASSDEKNAYENFIKALAISGNSDIQSLLWLADYNAKGKDFSAALAMCNQALIYKPDDAKIAYAKCKFLYEAGRISEAELFAKEKYSAFRDVNFLRICIRAALDNNNLQAAISYLELLRFSGKGSSNDCRLLGDLYFSMSSYHKALDFYAECGAQERLENLAMASVNMGDLGTAQKAIAQIKTSKKYDKIAGFISVETGNYQQAKIHFEKFLKTNPEDFSVVCELAEVLYNLKEYSKSALMFSRLSADAAYAKTSKYGMLRNALAIQNYFEALRIAQEISVLYPSAEINSFKQKLDKHCNELEKSAQ